MTKPEINALYFATHQMARPRGWTAPVSVGPYLRAALVLFFNYGVDTGTVWGSTPRNMSRYFGGMSRGKDNLLTVTPRSSPLGGGSSIAA